MRRATMIRALPYSHKVYVRQCDEPEGERWLARHGHKGSLKEFRACMHPHDTKSKVFVWLGPKAKIPEVCHEFIHAATWILKDSGVPVNWTTDEALAYLAERLVAEYLKKLERKASAEMRLAVGY